MCWSADEGAGEDAVVVDVTGRRLPEQGEEGVGLERPDPQVEGQDLDGDLLVEAVGHLGCALVEDLPRERDRADMERLSAEYDVQLPATYRPVS